MSQVGGVAERRTRITMLHDEKSRVAIQGKMKRQAPAPASNNCVVVFLPAHAGIDAIDSLNESSGTNEGYPSIDSGVSVEDKKRMKKRKRSVSRRISFPSALEGHVLAPRLSADSGVADVVATGVEIEPSSPCFDSLVVDYAMYDETADEEKDESPDTKGVADLAVNVDCLASTLEEASASSSDISACPSLGGPFCRICLDTSSDSPLIAPCLCSGTAGYCHATCLQTWLRTSLRENPKKEDFYRCGVCKGQYSVQIAYEKEGRRKMNLKDIFKLIFWFYCLTFVIVTPLMIYQSVVDYFYHRSYSLLFLIIFNCVSFVVYLYFSIYAVHAWILPALRKWNHSNRRLVVRPSDAAEPAIPMVELTPRLLTPEGDE